MGTASVRTAGKASGSIAADKAKALMEQFRTLAFWSLCDHYSQLITDLPTYKTTVHMGGLLKEVSDYADSAPGFLRKLGLQIDALADTHHWRHGDPRTEVFGLNMSEECYLPKPGVTPLMCPTYRGAATLPELLRAGNVNAADSSGWTPLMYAAYNGKDEVFDQLLDAGADPKVVSGARQTVMMAAISGHNWTARKMELLIEEGCDVNATDSAGRTALMFAVQQFWLSDKVAWLIANGARAGIKDVSGKPALGYLKDAYGKMHGEASGQAADYQNIFNLLQRARQ
jgi:hypothetical protein